MEMEIKINGESMTKMKDSLCEGSLNATEISQRMCDVSDVQIDMTLQTFELMKDYVSTVVGMF